jgi:hypothetical protein
MKQFLIHPELPKQYEKEIAETELPFVLEKSVAHLQEIIDHV